MGTLALLLLSAMALLLIVERWNRAWWRFL